MAPENAAAREIQPVEGCPALTGFPPVPPSSIGVTLCLRRWRRFCTVRHAEELELSVAFFRWQVSAQIRHGLRTWHAASKAGKDRREALHKHAEPVTLALKYWRRSCHSLNSNHVKSVQRRRSMRRAISTWTTAASSHNRQTVATALLRAASQRRSLQWWAAIARKQFVFGAANGNAKPVLVAVAQRRSLRLLREHIRRVRLRARLQAYSATLARRHACRGALQVWSDRVASRRKAHRTLLSITFGKWASWWRREQRVRVITKRAGTIIELGLRKRTLRVWEAMVAQHRHAYKNLRAMARRIATTLLAAAIRLWRPIAQEEKFARDAVPAAEARYARQLLQHHFKLLRTSFENALWKQELDNRAHRHSTRAMQKQFLHVWHVGSTLLRIGRQKWDMAVCQCSTARARQCFAIWVIALRACQLHRSKWQKAEHHFDLVAGRCAILEWRASMHAAQQFRLQGQVADNQLGRHLAKAAILVWTDALNAARQFRLQQQAADNLLDRRLAQAAMIVWTVYAGKRRTDRRNAAVSTARTCNVLQRRPLYAWGRAHAAAGRRRATSAAGAQRVIRAFFAWGAATVCVRERLLQLQHEWARLKQAMVFKTLRSAAGAQRLYRASVLTGLMRCVLFWWRCVLLEWAATREVLVAQGRNRHGHQLLRAALSGIRHNWSEVRSRRNGAQCLLEVLAHVTHSQSMLSKKASMGRLKEWLGFRRDFDLALLAFRITHLKTAFFRCWVKVREQGVHKRVLKLICDRFQEARLFRTFFARWVLAQTLVYLVADEVLVWAASTATCKVHAAIVAWYRHTVNKANSRRAEKAIRIWKRQRMLETWHKVFTMKLDANTLVESQNTALLRTVLGPWHQAAHISALRHRWDGVLTSAVLRIRRKGWLQRWQDGKRQYVLSWVAQGWDLKALGRRLLWRAMQAWFAQQRRTGAFEAIKGHVQRRRRRRAITGWRLLKQALSKRPCVLVKEALALWKKVRVQICRQRTVAGQLERQQLSKALRHMHDSCKHNLEDRKRRQQCGYAVMKHLLQAKIIQWNSSALAARDRRGGESRSRRKPAWKKLEEAMPEETQKRIRALRLRRPLGQWADARNWHHILTDWAAATLDWHAPQGVKEDRAPVHGAFVCWALRCRGHAAAKRSATIVACARRERSRMRGLRGWIRAFQQQHTAGSAEIILCQRRIGRLLHVWARFTSVCRCIAAHAAQRQVLLGAQLQRQCMMSWSKLASETACNAIAERHHRRHMLASVLRELRILLRHKANLHGAFQHLRLATTRMRTQREASGRHKTQELHLIRTMLKALATWTQKMVKLRARCSDLTSRTDKLRRQRRLGNWAMAGRAQQQQLLTRSLARSAFSLWANKVKSAFAACQTAALKVSDLNANLLRYVVELWGTLAVHYMRMRKACMAAETELRRQYCSRGFDRWRRAAAERHRLRCNLDRHRHREGVQVLQRCTSAWIRGTNLARATDKLCITGRKKVQRRCWNLWHAQVRAAKQNEMMCTAFHSLRASQRARTWLRSWHLVIRKGIGAKRLEKALDAAWGKRWVSEGQWLVHARADPALRMMFHQFADAIERQRAALEPAVSNAGPLAREDSFSSLVSLIWTRQQLSVALGQLRGYRQPWVLGGWPAEHLPLLPAESPYCMQAQMRLEALVAQLELPAGSGSLKAPNSMLHSGAVATAPPWQRALMWQASADLMVACRPRWRPTAARPPSAGMPARRRPCAAGPVAHVAKDSPQAAQPGAPAKQQNGGLQTANFDFNLRGVLGLDVDSAGLSLPGTPSSSGNSTQGLLCLMPNQIIDSNNHFISTVACQPHGIQSSQDDAMSSSWPATPSSLSQGSLASNVYPVKESTRPASDGNPHQQLLEPWHGTVPPEVHNYARQLWSGKLIAPGPMESSKPLRSETPSPRPSCTAQSSAAVYHTPEVVRRPMSARTWSDIKQSPPGSSSGSNYEPFSQDVLSCPLSARMWRDPRSTTPVMPTAGRSLGSAYTPCVQEVPTCPLSARSWREVRSTVPVTLPTGIRTQNLSARGTSPSCVPMRCSLQKGAWECASPTGTPQFGARAGACFADELLASAVMAEEM